MAIRWWRRREPFSPRKANEDARKTVRRATGGLGLLARLHLNRTATTVGVQLMPERDDRIIPMFGGAGACCIQESGGGLICSPDMSGQECSDLGGIFQGSGTTCVPDPCHGRGACCAALICITDKTAADCAAIGAVYQGHFSGCVPNPCRKGACCVGPNCLPNQTLAGCLDAGGIYQGHGTNCAVGLCTSVADGQVGACCVDSNSCCGTGTRCCVTTRGACCLVKGDWLGAGTDCGPPNPCLGDTIGACCIGPPPPPNQECLDGLTNLQCKAQPGGGTWYPDQACTPPPCMDIMGRCCPSGGLPCQMTNEPSCDGDWTPGSNCGPPDPCLPPAVGACCPSPVGMVACVISTLAACDGDYLGDGTNCGPPDPCLQQSMGACCPSPVGEVPCTVTTEESCTGDYLGDGVGCGPPDPCIQEPMGSCCPSGGGPCQIREESGCDGDWTQGGDCGPPDPCLPEPTGRCCPTGQQPCVITTQAMCFSGDWIIGGNCGPPDPCLPPPLGRCCPSFFAPCEIVTEAQCNSDDWIQGGNCGPPDPCIPQQQGACCPSPVGEVPCIVTTQLLCTGDYLGDGTDCGPPDPCLIISTGACCFGSSCVPNQTQDECGAEGGIWRGPGSVCNPNPCPQDEIKGACCPKMSLACILTTQQRCRAQFEGDYLGDGTDCGPPDPCRSDHLRGACCFGTSCVPDQTQDECQSELGVFQGVGSTCEPNPCNVEAVDCCFDDCSCINFGTAKACTDAGGTPHLLGFCGAGLCCGACCQGILNSECEMTRDPEACALNNGIWKGFGSNCNQSPCPVCCCFDPELPCPPGGKSCAGGSTTEECVGAGGFVRILNCCIPN